MAEKNTQIAGREPQRIGHRESRWFGDQFTAMDRFADEIERLFDDFGFSRSSLSPRFGRSRPSSESWTSSALWTPTVEVFERNNELVVRTDLPGMKKDDVKIEVTDRELVISGERRQEHESEREGYYRSERSYGSFYRAIPLPEGAITDQAKASFRDGVLEITVPAPPQSTRGRRLEIKEGTDAKK